jgi:hypothetical protein
MKYFKFITYNFLLKVFAIIAALYTWAFISSEIQNSRVVKTAPSPEVFPSYGKVVSRKMYVKAIFIGKPADGCELVVNNVKIDPEYFIMAAPAKVFEKVDKLETEPIDVTGFKKTVIVETNLAPADPSIDMEKLSVKVAVPIQKIEKEEKR